MNASTLSPARRQLLLRLQTLNFGRIENLRLQDGEPVLDPPPRVVREVKFGGDNSPRPEADLRDFQLKAQVTSSYSGTSTASKTAWCACSRSSTACLSR